MPNVFQKMLEGEKGSRLAVQLLGLLHAAVRPVRRSLRFVRGESSPLEVLLQHRQVRIDLARQFALCAAHAKQVYRLGKEAPHLLCSFRQQFIHEPGHSPPP